MNERNDGGGGRIILGGVVVLLFLISVFVLWLWSFVGEPPGSKFPEGHLRFRGGHRGRTDLLTLPREPP
jgi:hypothetical protein